jgi:Trp operon repressor
MNANHPFAKGFSEFFNQDTFSSLFAQVCATNKLTLADRYRIKAALLSGNLDQEELGCVDRLLYGVRRGRIKLSTP